MLGVAFARENLDEAEQHLKVQRDALPRLDIVRVNRLCGTAIGGILARPDARHIGLAGGLVVAFCGRPIVVVDGATRTSCGSSRRSNSRAQTCRRWQTARRDAEARAFQDAAKIRGITVQIFGLSQDNARAFWNWQFLKDQEDMPQTRAMLMRACDLRLPARLGRADVDFIADALLAAVADVKRPRSSAA